ncbi:hypothetical protein KOR42_34430 [Thalassoglobus neptunius]|uniref:Uncharacterized protein n=1 Tax=Thalassoglobus neptunius TaxID=1938619 RepID=A0A5C5WLT5_9PLAN|nr:hypothetical protein [Thalassoglobus neptunius]TWT51756.1 hypothetical protein KOR42_34430 [Thalassoglobus neptunius]
MVTGRHQSHQVAIEEDRREFGELCKVVYPQDRDGAQSFFDRIEPNPKFKKVDSDVECLSKQHAQRGPRDFELFFGIREPRHHSEKLLKDFYFNQIDRQSFELKTREFSELPLTIEKYQCLVEDREDVIAHYSKFLCLIGPAYHRGEDETNPELETLASYHARELRRECSFFRQELEVFQLQISELRHDIRQTWIEVGDFKANTVSSVIHKVMYYTSKLWFEYREIARGAKQMNATSMQRQQRDYSGSRWEKNSRSRRTS